MANSIGMFVSGGGGFDPTWGVASCVLAAYSDLGITKDGSDRVSNWALQFGDSPANDFVQATDAKKFIWTSNQLNGYPALIADGEDDYMTSAIAVNQPATIFLVAKSTVVSRYFCDGDDGASRWVLGDSLDIAGQYCIYAGNTVINLAYTRGTYQIHGCIFNGASSKIWLNNGSQTSGNAGTHNLTGMALGCMYSLASGFLNGGLVSMLIYNSSLSAADQLTVYNGLNGRYAIY